MFEQFLSDLPATVQFANEVFSRHADLVKEGLAKLGLAADQRDRSCGDTLARHIDQQKADAVAFSGVGVGADQAEDPVRDIGPCRPDFGTRDHKMITFVFSPCRETGEVRARTGLRISLGPPDFSTDDARYMQCFLFG